MTRMFEERSNDDSHMYLPSVECTCASVMRNQQSVCSFRKGHAMVPGVVGWWQICVVTKRFWLKQSTPTGLRDAHPSSAFLWTKTPRDIQFISSGITFYFTLDLCPCVILQRNSRCRSSLKALHACIHSPLEIFDKLMPTTKIRPEGQ